MEPALREPGAAAARRGAANSGEHLHLGVKDSESLDTCIQSTLSALYPPFEATAATVLWQLFGIVEKLYRGDGLRCLIDFLVPAKRILQCIQQETCAKYTGLIFYHEGWPLCIHEKVVVQLASLHKVRLKPGDFYFQLVPQGKQSAKLVLKCLFGHGQQGIEEVIIPDIMYGSIFTAEFLEHVNLERNGFPLQCCLLTTGAAVYRTPWKNIVNPIFVPTAETILHNYSSDPFVDSIITENTDATGLTQTMESNSSHDSSASNDTTCTAIEAIIEDSVDDVFSSEDLSTNGAETELPPNLGEGSEGAHADPTPHQHESSDEGILQSDEGSDEIQRMLQDRQPSRSPETGSTKALTLTADISNATPRRQPIRDSAAFETRRLFRQSYMEALQNPMPLGSSSEESITEEALEAVLDSCTDEGVFRTTDLETYNEDKDRPSVSSSALSRKHSKDGVGSQERNRLSSEELLSSDESLPQSGSKASPRRTHPFSRSRAASQGKGQVKADSVNDSSAMPPTKMLNGQASRLDATDLHGPLPLAASNLQHSHEDAETAIQDSKHAYQRDQLITAANGSLSPTQSDRKELSEDLSELSQRLPKQLLEINQELLQSGAICIPGTRDRAGRAIVQICMRHSIWLREHCTCAELTRLLMYYLTIPRKDVRDLGLVVLVDYRKCQLIPVLFKSLIRLQNALPNSINSALILVDKESAFKPDKECAVQCEVLWSLKALHKHIDSTQLTSELEGTFPYSHSSWLRFHMKLEPFIASCKEAVVFLQKSIRSLNANRTLSSVQAILDTISKHKTMMKRVLEDTLLVTLRLEGGTTLARLRRDEFCNTEDYRDAMETISVLYNQVDEEVHRLVLLSNNSLQQLENTLELRKFEEGCDQIQLWLENETVKHLGPLECELLSLETVKRKQEEFEAFSGLALQHCSNGLQLTKSSNLQTFEEKSEKFTNYLNEIIGQTEKRKSELALLVNLYEFYDMANGWMLHCNEFLEQFTVKNRYCQSAVQQLESYHDEATKVSAENFRKVNEMVLTLGSEKELKQWNILWLKCQQTRHHLEEVLSDVTKDLRNLDPNRLLCEENQKTKAEDDGHLLTCAISTDANIWDNDNSLQYPQSSSPDLGLVSPSSNEDSSMDVFTDFNYSPEQPGSGRSRDCQSIDSFLEDMDRAYISGPPSCFSEPIQSPASRHRKHPLKKIMKKTKSFELSQLEASHGDVHRCGYTGVLIKGLEVASTVTAEKVPLHRLHGKSPLLSRNRSLSSPSRIHHHTEEERKKTGSGKIYHIMDEMVTTEREYVRSLGYISDNYFPEMERMDLPQDLRGKRNIIFGNLEKLYDFHCQYFLKELEHCMECPLRVSQCFLRHEEQFGMYALYSKNKPQSDALLISHANNFFKNKQQELGDKMDLASYLLKPIQRMSKYALLLKDMIKECTKTQEQELSDLKAAEEMVKFQLRHGNDLLAMDAIRGCDVNLKEQGQLRCQDEFIVWCGRKKNLRHVFLFEDLILFSKTKKIDGGYDLYIYKQSFKTAEIGMTETVGDSGLRFEIWFRRRKSQDTYILQASSAEVKAVWTKIIGKILWRQALRNREMRMQEMVSMGIGNKPFMDIQPSEAAINDRAIDYIMKGTESRSRASVAVSSFDHGMTFKRPHSTISNSSTSSSSSHSSSSLLGSLNLHVYSSPSYAGLPGSPFYQWSYDIGTCIEEDEQETGSQPSMMTGSSESSRCTSGESACGFSSSVYPVLAQLPVEPFGSEDSSNTRDNPPSASTSPTLPEKTTVNPTRSRQFVTANTSHVISLSTAV
ncbi:pleckstrin homology domain-containing family G member 4B isoform X2 [Ambystoma mexicanum]|uniref:pleckstrin homology domain-containing family G member 4B isoform X2 n=1 Tax=Ambystoma mexicanum TaxID=8296 RepID=UPI0037E8112A